MRPLPDAQDWDALEDAWLESLEADTLDIQPLLRATESAARQDRRRATALLALLAGELLSRKVHPDAAQVLRYAVSLAPANQELRSLVRRLLKERSPDQWEADRMLDFVGFDSTPVLEAWDQVDALSSLKTGCYVVHDTWGPGKVAEFETMTEEVVVDFSGRLGHHMSWSMALKALTPLPREHLLAMTVDRADELARLAPVELLALAVRSLGGEADPKDIKRLVEPVVGADAWAGWWTKARAAGKDDPRLHFSLARPLRVRWVGTDAGQAAPPDQLTELAELSSPEMVRLAPRVARDQESRDAVRSILRSRLPSVRRTPSLHLEALLVLHSLGDQSAATETRTMLESSEDPIAMVLSVRSTDLRHGAMTLLQSMEQAAQIRRELFLKSGNPTDWEELSRQMSEGERLDLGTEVHRGLPENAALYFWMVRKAESGFPVPGTPLERAMRLVDVLDESPGLVGQVTSYVADDRVFQNAVAEGESDKAAQLLAFLTEARLPVSLKDEIRADLYARFPALRPTHDIIFSTPEGLQKREAELRRLVKEELPQNKKALAEAKAHGDLRENFEYKAAKEQQDRILARSMEIQSELARVRILTKENIDTERVGPGCRILLRGEDGVEHAVVILGPWDSDPDAGVFSHRAPGLAPLLGRRTGELVVLDLPAVSGSFRIEQVSSALS